MKVLFFCECALLFHDGGPYQIETSPLICSASQWTGFYMIGSSVMKELKNKSTKSCCGHKPQSSSAMRNLATIPQKDTIQLVSYDLIGYVLCSSVFNS